MTAHLLFIRHAMPEIEPEVDAAEWRLSAAGRDAALALAASVRPYAPAAIYSSVEPKAVETAEIIGAALNRPVRPRTALREHDRRGAPYTTPEAFRAAVARLFRDPDTLFFGNETARQALHRFAAVVDRLAADHTSETIAIVTHGTVLTLFLADRCGVDPIPFWRELQLPDLVITNHPPTKVTAER